LCTTVVHNTAQSSFDYLPSYPPDKHQSSDAVYWRGGGFAKIYCNREISVTNNCNDYAVINVILLKRSITVKPGNCQQTCKNNEPCKNQGCYRYFPKVSPIFDIDTGLKSMVDTDIDTLP